MKNANRKLSAREKEKLGRSTWHLLHTIAKHYPTNPTLQEKKAVYDLVNSLSVLYPCPPCASGMELFSKSNLLNTNSKLSLSLSFCEFHNWINAKLQKPLVSCSDFINDHANRKQNGFVCLSRFKTHVESFIQKIKNII
ncbi:mitochondrial FAD-linked sulfhydryl oxidase [Nematocida minor]|uniref:mitochondrial FAD-linked sulfhydryl oxidase n=1 Tax=Nematocida minor TaxID=1912983 RepID=UPI002220A1F2|nr:mitochondrial FAD-linked sulfhydryl oxidase [Nematocida minor]KAI5190243.1 mitochondrial FAD-linked sulfhydryl oxidase [Nematocida minor]